VRGDPARGDPSEFGETENCAQMNESRADAGRGSSFDGGDAQFDVRDGIPHLGCFAARVWKCLNRREIAFFGERKSAEECEKKGDSWLLVRPSLSLWARKSAEEYQNRGDERWKSVYRRAEATEPCATVAQFLVTVKYFLRGVSFESSRRNSERPNQKRRGRAEARRLHRRHLLQHTSSSAYAEGKRRGIVAVCRSITTIRDWQNSTT
jgi:hypothetical protein